MSESQDNQTFHRCPHDKEHPFALVNRSLIRDKTISPDCRWLLIYLLSNQDSWKINVKQIIGHCEGFIGKNKIYRIIKEAIDAGYMEKEIYYAYNLKRARYIVSEEPKFKKCFPHPQNGDTETRKLENGPIKEEHIEDIPKEERVGAAAPAPVFSSKIERATHVSTTEKEHNDLVAKFGLPMTEAAYKRLSEWKLDTPRGKWKKDDNRSIHRWVISALEDEAKKKGKNTSPRVEIDPEIIGANRSLANKAESYYWAMRKEGCSLTASALHAEIRHEGKDFVKKIPFEQSAESFKQQLKEAIGVLGVQWK